MKVGQDHRPKQETSSSPPLALDDGRQCGIIRSKKIVTRSDERGGRIQYLVQNRLFKEATTPFKITELVLL